MTGVEVILAALTAGAGAGVTTTANTAVVDAYQGLKELLARRMGHGSATPAVAGDLVPDVDTVPGIHQAEADAWRTRMATELSLSGAAGDTEILTAARHLLALLESQGALPVAYQVDAREAKGVQVGDRNIQNNTFS
ncbi:hypothetical protein P3T29_005380 [Kitasatospora sp. MAP5-34]|nr:hypothetical protein [Kitasatospora sp. MAP5-34]